MLRVAVLALLTPLVLLSQLRAGGFETEVGFPKPIGLFPLGLFVVSASGATLRFSGDNGGTIGNRWDTAVLLRLGVNPFRLSFIGRRRRGVVLSINGIMASAGPGVGESKSSGARRFLPPEGAGEVDCIRENEYGASVGRCISTREAGRD